MSKMFDYISGETSGKEAELEASLEHTAGYLGVEIEENAKLRAENERLRAGIRWALGEAPDDTGAHFGDAKPPLEAKYWWRTVLRRMAGMGNLAYDKATRTIVDRGHQQNSEVAEESK